MEERMNGYEALVEEYRGRKGQVMLDKRAELQLSQPQIPHARPEIEVRPPP